MRNEFNHSQYHHKHSTKLFAKLSDSCLMIMFQTWDKTITICVLRAFIIYAFPFRIFKQTDKHSHNNMYTVKNITFAQTSVHVTINFNISPKWLTNYVTGAKNVRSTWRAKTIEKLNKRAQRALGRSPEEKVKGHSGSNNREPQRHNWNNFGWGPLDDAIYQIWKLWVL